MIKFKHEVDRLLFPYLAPSLIRTLGEMACYCEEKGEELVITETISDLERDRERGITRVSKSHDTHRAADIRIKKWEKVFTVNFVDWFNIRLQAIAALTYGGQRVICVLKDDHIHVQVDAKFSIKSCDEVKALLRNSSNRRQPKHTQGHKS